jgi:hypothetical protein
MKSFVVVFFTTIILIWPAIYNGYPFFYSDSASYIASGFELQTPSDRPITYGILIWLTSLGGFSIWGIIIFQNTILSWLLYKNICAFCNSSYNSILSLIVVFLLTSLTGISWVSTQVMTDVFTPVIFLSATLILSDKIYDKPSRIILYIIFTIATATHLSHIVLNLCLIFCCGTFYSFAKKKNIYSIYTGKKLLNMFLLTIVAYVPMMSAASKSSAIFYMSRMSASGIAQKYLNAHCDNMNYKLCAYKNVMPTSEIDFLWSPDSPLQKTGGWKANRAECRKIVWSLLTSPEYYPDQILAAYKSSIRQLTLFDVGEGEGIFSEGTVVYDYMKEYFQNEMRFFTSSKQYQYGEKLFVAFNGLYRTVFYMSVIIIAIIFFAAAFYYKKFNNKTIFIFTGFILFSILLSNCITASLSVAVHRYGAKVAWLVTFVLLVVLVNIIPLVLKSRFRVLLGAR